MKLIAWWRHRRDAERQTRGYSGARFRGYSQADGGYQQALIDYEAHIASSQSASSDSSVGSETDETDFEQPVNDGFFIDTKGDPRNVSAWDRQGQKERYPPTGRSISEPGTKGEGVSATKGNKITVCTAGRVHSANKRTLDIRAMDNLPQIKKQRSGSAREPLDCDFRSCLSSEIGEGKKDIAFTTNPGSSTNNAISLISDDEQPSSTRSAIYSTMSPAGYISLPASDGEDEFDCKSLDLILSRSISHINPTLGPDLCKEQADLVETIMSGKNVFYTGSAGCGKSTVLRCFVKCLKDLGKRVEIVAPTGRAALNVDGKTFWSYAGWTPSTMKKPMKEILAACCQKRTWKRINATDVLVIDEISMMESFYLERLNRIMKEARSYKCDNAHKPFGGVQVVISGDFCQLPPVQPMKHCLECGEELQPIPGYRKKCLKHGEYKLSDQWAFKSAAWRECNFVHTNLSTIHRQKDLRFIGILEKLRVGKSLSLEEKNLLKNHDSQTDGAVKIFSKRDDVRKLNDREFNRLQSPIFEYRCYDHFQRNPDHEDLTPLEERDPIDGSLVALNEHRFDKETYLRVGMAVVLLVNLNVEEGLVNGSQGEIIRFDSTPTKRELTEASGEHGSHKQGLLYRFIRTGRLGQWPVVRFLNGREKTIYPQCMVGEYGATEPWSLLSRTQIPLMAAWAMTIHKAQGMTLDRVVVDLADTFEKGHDYVALSRARGLEGLKVESLGRLDKGINEEVRAFLAENFGIL